MEIGKHNASIPVDKIIGRELEIIGSHGMQAHRYPEMLEMIENGILQPEKLIGGTISLDDAPDRLVAMDSAPSKGISVIDFSM